MGRAFVGLLMNIFERSTYRGTATPQVNFVPNPIGNASAWQRDDDCAATGRHDSMFVLQNWRDWRAE